MTRCLFIYIFFVVKEKRVIGGYGVCYRICYSITRMRLAHDPVASFC